MDKRKREDFMHAQTQQGIFLAGGIKIKKRQPRIEDFLPSYLKEENDPDALLMKEWEEGFARQEALRKAQEKRG